MILLNSSWCAVKSVCRYLVFLVFMSIFIQPNISAKTNLVTKSRITSYENAVFNLNEVGDYNGGIISIHDKSGLEHFKSLVTERPGCSEELPALSNIETNFQVSQHLDPIKKSYILACGKNDRSGIIRVIDPTDGIVASLRFHQGIPDIKDSLDGYFRVIKYNQISLKTLMHNGEFGKIAYPKVYRLNASNDTVGFTAVLDDEAYNFYFDYIASKLQDSIDDERTEPAIQAALVSIFILGDKSLFCKAIHSVSNLGGVLDKPYLSLVGSELLEKSKRRNWVCQQERIKQ